MLAVPPRLVSLGEPGVSGYADRIAQGRNPEWDIDWEIGKNGELFVLDVIQSLKDGARVEVKTDLWAAATGNIYIEYMCRYFGEYKPSGIAVTTAEIWALVLATEVIVFTPVDRLKAVARYYYALGRRKNGGTNGSHPTWGVLVPVANLLRNLMNPPELPPRPRELSASQGDGNT